MPDYARIYARQEYLTPAAPETVALVGEALTPRADSLLVEIASGKGEAACALAARFDCRVLAVDVASGFLRDARRKAASRGLAVTVAPIRADGRRLPLADAAADAAYCIGAPSIVGLAPCLREIARVLKPGGGAVVSDIVWRARCELGPEWGAIRDWPQLTLDDYRAAVAGAGLRLERVVMHPRSVWEAYFRPMLEVARDARAAGDDEFAAQIDALADLEGRGADALYDYMSLVCRCPAAA